MLGLDATRLGVRHGQTTRPRRRGETATSQGQRAASECPQGSRPASRQLGAFLPPHPLWGRWGRSRRRSSVCWPCSLWGAGFQDANREDQQLFQGPSGIPQLVLVEGREAFGEVRT